MTLQSFRRCWDDSRSTGETRLVLLALADSWTECSAVEQASISYLAKTINSTPIAVQQALHRLSRLSEIDLIDNGNGEHVEYRLLL